MNYSLQLFVLFHVKILNGTYFIGKIFVLIVLLPVHIQYCLNLTIKERYWSSFGERIISSLSFAAINCVFLIKIINSNKEIKQKHQKLVYKKLIVLIKHFNNYRSNMTYTRITALKRIHLKIMRRRIIQIQLWQK